MAGNRADSIINSSGKRTEFFSDFMTSFAKTPIGDQLSRSLNERSINQSLKNLILTGLGERLYQPAIGSFVQDILFEPNFESSLNSLNFYIQNTIENNEPRVDLISIDSKVINDNEINISIYYRLINNPEPISYSFILRRVR